MTESTQPLVDRRSPIPHDYPSVACNSKIEAIKSDLRSDITDIKMSLKDLSLALTKLVLLEERQSQQYVAQERIFKVLEKLENRMTEIEKHEPVQAQTNEWVHRAMWAAAAAAAVFVAKKVGLM